MAAESGNTARVVPPLDEGRDVRLGPFVGRQWGRGDWWIRLGAIGWGISYRRHDFTQRPPIFSERYGYSPTFFWGSYQNMRSLRILRPMKRVA